MTTFSPESQRNFLIQWFKSWSDFQKDDFLPILSQKISATPGQVNGIMNGMLKLDLDISSRPPSLFSCQLKLFSEWWDTWAEPDRQQMKDLIKEADLKFWDTLESEMKGTREKLNEDFMIVTSEGDLNGAVLETNNKVSPVPPPVFNVKQILPGGGGSDGEGQDDQSGEEVIDGAATSEVVESEKRPEIRQELEDEGLEV